MAGLAVDAESICGFLFRADRIMEVSVIKGTYRSRLSMTAFLISLVRLGAVQK